MIQITQLAVITLYDKSASIRLDSPSHVVPAVSLISFVPITQRPGFRFGAKISSDAAAALSMVAVGIPLIAEIEIPPFVVSTHA